MFCRTPKSFNNLFICPSVYILLPKMYVGHGKHQAQPIVWSSISNPAQERAISEERHLCLGDTGGVHHLLVPGAHILPLSATRKPGGPHWFLGTRQAWESYRLRRPGESACTFSYPSPPQHPPATQATRRAAPPNDGRPPPQAPRPPGSASNERPAGAGRAGSLSS